jgi:pimeloyl-ACP methyl ester carboxylesterase
MAPVARELAARWGILELLQSTTSLDEQIEGTQTILQESGNLPLILIGFSWGAWLGLMVAARYPQSVGKLILIGCGPLSEEYARGIFEIRSGRLSLEERAEVRSIIDVMNDPTAVNKNRAFQRLGILYSKADAFDPIENGPDDSEIVECSVEIFQKVWKEAVELRKSGKLLQLVRHITCPVVAIHGDYDPHPAEGVRRPLSAILRTFRFILIEKCGHKPWIEKEAKACFYEVLSEELEREDDL